MKASETAMVQAKETGAYSLGPGEGDARRVFDELDTFKATSAQTGGSFALKESRSTPGSGPPLHVHEREDEACFVIDGDVTVFVGDEVVRATAGSWIYLPRRIPHSIRTESDEARTVWLIVPGGFDLFFTELFPSAADDAAEQPDLERVAATAARYGVTVLGPTPDRKE